MTRWVGLSRRGSAGYSGWVTPRISPARDDRKAKAPTAKAPTIKAGSTLGPNLTLEHLHKAGPVCGVDEAGRGPWAGPVCAAAVILHPQRVPEGVDDSKKLTAKARDRLEGEIKLQALAWGVAFASVEEIAELNILHATGLAMRRAMEAERASPPTTVCTGQGRGKR